MGHNAIRLLLKIFKRSVIATGEIHPFEGPLYDRDHNMILEKYGTLKLVGNPKHEMAARGRGPIV